MQHEPVNNNHSDTDTDDSSWNGEIESYIRNILAECQKASKHHDDAGYKAKGLNATFALPAVLIPLLMAPIQGTFKDEEWTPYVSMAALVASSLVSGVSTFFNFGAKSQKHFNVSARYDDIITDIEECLAKKVSKRQPSAVFMRTQKMRFDNLNQTAPK